MRKARESAMKGEYFRNIWSMHISKQVMMITCQSWNTDHVTKALHLSHVNLTE